SKIQDGGLKLSYGIAELNGRSRSDALHEADLNLKADKAARKAAGLRTDRVEAEGVTDVTPERIGEVESVTDVTPETTPETEVDTDAEAAGDPNIGRTWQSPNGARTVEGFEQTKNGPRYLVRTEGERHVELMPPDMLERMVAVDEANTKSRAEAETKDRERAEREAKAKAEREDLDGFTDSMTPLQAGKVKQSLTQRVNYKG